LFKRIASLFKNSTGLFKAEAGSIRILCLSSSMMMSNQGVAMKRLIEYLKSPEGLLVIGLSAMVVGVAVSLAHALAPLY
jgi:hypothetical protein